MDENDKRADKAQRDFDLTTPNIHVPKRDQNARPPQQGSDFDRTTINNPPPRQESKVSRPSSAQNKPAQNKFDLTSINIGVPFDEEEEQVRSRPIAPQAPQPATVPISTKSPTKTQAKRRAPLWVWLTVGSVVLLLTGGAVALFFLSSNQAFTLRVLNAPPGSKVYIDDIPSGVPQKDGTIIVQGLRAGEPREVRVVQSGFAEWKTTVTGEGGQVQDITANLTRLETKPVLPPEIDYNGRMVLIPAGAFTMGSNTGNADEAPEHTVDLPAYYIDKYEVTNEQYGKFCDATSHPRPVNPFWDPQYFENNPQMPGIGISYADAEAYAAWAGKRLPTEAEWEKAASWGPSATTKRRFPWGDAPEKGRANIDGTEHPTNVGQYATGASAYGVHDMTGNVREWVDAIYNPYPGSTASNPKFGQGQRVARGGDFRANLDFARTTNRLAVSPTYKTNPEDQNKMLSSLIGFRCAISIDDPKLKAHLQQSNR